MSQVHGTWPVVSFKAGATISAYQVVRLSANNTVIAYDTTTVLAIGIAQQASSGATGSSVLVACDGFCLARAAASITAGDILQADGGGTGLVSTRATTTTASIGRAICSADTNSTVEIKLDLDVK